jgi:hypothetical protein
MVLERENAIMRLQNKTPFRSAMDVQQTFQQFEAVIWYRANETSFSSFLHDYQTGIEGYLDNGGKLFLEGLYLIEGRNAVGALSPSFVTDYLNCRGMLSTFVITPACWTPARAGATRTTRGSSATSSRTAPVSRRWPAGPGNPAVSACSW